MTRKWEEMEALVMAKLEENTRTLKELQEAFYEYQRSTDKSVVILQTKMGMLAAGISAAMSVLSQYVFK